MSETLNKNYTYDQLVKSNVRSIWVYASSLGIIAPSKFKKEDLIQRILDIQSGKEEIIIKEKRGRGRPQKSSLTTTEVMYSPNADSNVVEKTFDVSGVFYGNVRNGFILTKNVAGVSFAPYITTEVLKTCGNVVNGDFIKCTATKYVGNPIPVISSVNEINGVKSGDEEGKEFLKMQLKLTPEQITFNEDKTCCLLVNSFVPFFKGARGIVLAKERFQGLTTILNNLASGVKGEDYKIVYALTSEKQEEKQYVSREITEDCYGPSNKSGSSGVKYSVRTAFSKAKQYFIEGNNVILIIDELENFYNAVDMEKDENGKEEIENILSYAENTEKGSLSIIVGVTESVFGESVNELIQKFNWQLVLSKTLSDMRIYPAIDLILSRSKNDSDLIDEELYNAVNKIRRKIIKGAEIDEMTEKLTCLKTQRDIIEFSKTL